MLSSEASTPRRPRWPEITRILIILAAAIAVMSAFLTPLQIGGVDSLWYAHMTRGVTDQIAAGHFPSPVGMGWEAYNGGVHPFRSAPIYPMLAGLWGVLTLGRLGEFSIQHLVAITSTLVGTLGFYLAAAKLLPGRRWAALAFSLIYLTTPSWLAEVVNIEDYMTYMAFAAMPLVLYGNAVSVLESDGRGYVPLGAGLALVWMCHPPIALLTCLTTLFIQTGAAVARGFAPWRGLAAGAAVFAVLSAYYFASMSELPRAAEGNEMAVELRSILGLALFFTGIGRYALRPRNIAWIACALLGAIMVGISSRPWLIWISCSAAFWIAAVVAVRWSRLLDLPRNAFVMLFVCSLLGAAAAGAILGPDLPGAFGSPLIVLAENTADIPAMLRPLTPPHTGMHLLQLGWGLDIAVVLAAFSLFGTRPLGAKLFFAASLGLVICTFRVPLVSAFLDGYFPRSMMATCGAPLRLRIMPVIASFSSMAGVLWLATLPKSSRWTTPVLAALAVLAAWGGYQSDRFIVSAHSLTSSTEGTDKSIRPENVALARYAYDLMQLPAYYCNNVADPRLESRLLDGAGRIVVGPVEAARLLEAQSVRQVRLVCMPIKNSDWFDLSPAFTLEPGEHIVLRFDFDPNRTYNGYLFLIGEHEYREYHLPDSGLDKAFGIGGTRTTVLSVWNSGKEAEHVHFSMHREPGNNLNVDGGFFANLSMSKYDPQYLPVSLESLIPYRASVSTATGGWLETFVLYLPGYRASVDGNLAPVAKSAEGLAEIQVPAGRHSIELRFVGTLRLWLAALVSASGWTALVVLWLRRVGS
jgi:hypothetical protein